MVTLGDVRSYDIRRFLDVHVWLKRIADIRVRLQAAQGHMKRIDTSSSDDSGKLSMRKTSMPTSHHVGKHMLPQHTKVDTEEAERVDTSTETDEVEQVRKPTPKATQSKKTHFGSRKKRQLPCLKRKREDTRIATSDDDSGRAVSLSPESARLHTARAELRKRLPVASENTTRISSSCNDTTDSDVNCTPVSQGGPATSGVFDYVEWVVRDHLSSLERQTLCSKCPITVGSMCSGMGTEDIALRAIERALLTSGQDGFQTTSTFKAESDPRKAEFLSRHFAPKTQIFTDNAALADTLPVNMHGEQVERPTCKILVCGIVCVDVSGLTMQAKPVSGQGKSGMALRGLLQSLHTMPFEGRPIMLNLECVARLGQRRRVDPDNITGTQYVTDELAKLGYVGSWCKVRPRSFFLPQSRPRVYAIHLKRKDLSETSAAARKQDVDKAFQLIQRMQTTTAENLEILLERIPMREEATSTGKRTKMGQTRTKGDGSNRKWPSTHAAYAEKHGLSVVEREVPVDFVSEVASFISPRAMDAIWLKVAVWCKRNDKDWRQALLVLAHGFSISFNTVVRQAVFPCVTPTHTYVILQRGKSRLSNGLTALAVQGIQSKEIESFHLAKEDDTLLRDFAGNAFTANIIAAFLIAGMLVM